MQSSNSIKQWTKISEFNQIILLKKCKYTKAMATCPNPNFCFQSKKAGNFQLLWNKHQQENWLNLKAIPQLQLNLKDKQNIPGHPAKQLQRQNLWQKLISQFGILKNYQWKNSLHKTTSHYWTFIVNMK